MELEIFSIVKASTYLSGELEELAPDREVSLHHGGIVLVSSNHDLLNRKAFVEWHIQELHVVALDEALGPAGHVPEVPGSDSLNSWAVGLDSLGQELVGLVLGLELGGELGSGDSDPALLLWRVWMTFHSDLDIEFPI